MLTGEFNHSIDSKGRLIIPSKLRESLGEHFVITKGMDGCLFLYPDNEWKAFEEKLRTLPLTNKNARKFSRFFVAGATTCELDRQGRILVPATLREFGVKRSSRSIRCRGSCGSSLPTADSTSRRWQDSMIRCASPTAAIMWSCICGQKSR